MNKKNLFLMFLMSLLISVFMIGCSTDEPPTEDGQVETDETETVENGAFPLEITDSTDHTIVIEEEPSAIISVMPSNTEILFALGLGDKVIAVTENDTYPEEVFDLDTVGDFELNVEKIISLNPDLVVAHASSVSSSFDAFQQILDANINVYFVKDAQTIEETYVSIEEIGKITGATDEATQLIKNMQDSFAEIEAKVADISEDERNSVFFEISPEPEIYTAGNGTFFNELVELIQADNAASDIDGWAQLDPEAIVELNPDIILTLYGSYVEDAKEQVLNRDGFSNVNAVINEQVFDVNEDIVSRPGPRLVEGAIELGKVVYPDYFND